MSSVANLDSLFTEPLIIWSSIAIIVFSISSQIFRVKAFKYTNDPALIAPGMYFSIVVAAVLDSYIYHINVGFIEMLGIVINMLIKHIINH